MDDFTNQDALSVVQAHAPIFSPAEQEACRALLDAGQHHLFAAWPPVGTDDDKKRSLLSQAASLHDAYPLADYASNARALLYQSATGVNPYDGYIASPPTAGVSLDPETPSGLRALLDLEAIGTSLLPATAFVLVAGGLGERLGFNGIKLSLPSTLLTGESFLETYANTLHALQARARVQTGEPSLELPLVIMTSDETHEGTLALLSRHNYFGLSRAQVTLLKQAKVPAVIDSRARFATHPDDPYDILTKPHGHGDVHLLLHRHPDSPLSSWVAGGRVKYLFFFQDTNALVFNAFLSTLGLASRDGLAMTTVCAPRKPGDAVGAICHLKRAVSRRDSGADDSAAEESAVAVGSTPALPCDLTINVEYNVLSSLLGATEPTLPDGTSPFPGNVNAFVLCLQQYAAVLARCKGIVAEFVNPKYTDASKTTFVKPARLECMMQDYPALLPPSARVGFAQYPAWFAFSPVKNAPADAAVRQSKGLAPEAAASGEFAIYEATRRMLKICCPAASLAAEPLPLSRLSAVTGGAPSSGECECDCTECQQHASGRYTPSLCRWASPALLNGVRIRRGAALVLAPSLGVGLRALMKAFVTASAGTIALGPKAAVVLGGCNYSDDDAATGTSAGSGVRVGRIKANGYVSVLPASYQTPLESQTAKPRIIDLDLTVPAADVVAASVRWVPVSALPGGWQEQIDAAAVRVISRAAPAGHADTAQAQAEGKSLKDVIIARGYSIVGESSAALSHATLSFPSVACSSHSPATSPGKSKWGSACHGEGEAKELIAADLASSPCAAADPVPNCSHGAVLRAHEFGPGAHTPFAIVPI